MEASADFEKGADRWQPTDPYDAPVGNVKTSDVQRVTIARR